jgi:hypothetical protein
VPDGIGAVGGVLSTAVRQDVGGFSVVFAEGLADTRVTQLGTNGCGSVWTRRYEKHCCTIKRGFI